MNLFHHHREESGVTQPDPNAPPAADPNAAPDPTAVVSPPGTDARDAEWEAKLAAMQMRVDQMAAQLAAQAQAQAQAAPSIEAPPVGLASGTYTPNDDVTLTVWEKGDPAPNGFTVVVSSDGSRVAVKLGDDGQPVRDTDGNAYSIHEGTAIAVHADGHYEYLSNPDDVTYFSRRFREAGQ